ncbi:hypothetical protein SPRG_16597 [Saprolegnia parasitica CBS 223.65]|uniref:RING-type domain-containing protein n=1 Tax=Saprolegnia parasitica (strain CBS 223.65) TaxID=695850 RepID=A0A067BTQ0_SAPPC|nr:hypothetical protein SPRG_16597 [Saprolegnia parasitica CBS 223.65]KDO18027.1 hypothetical protein SPRG_16597 [Saprolegnia parasitica CBS 223.65]|eukprot:XP_012211270.1 hypothetical protein SPRG_16597 [Saprolegnia parasitica CBS 223.65]
MGIPSVTIQLPSAATSWANDLGHDLNQLGATLTKTAHELCSSLHVTDLVSSLQSALTIDNHANRQAALLEYRGSNGRTPLLVAAAKDHVACVEILLQHGANVMASDNSGNNALHYACFQGAVNAARFLLSPAVGLSPFSLNTHGLAPTEMVRASLAQGEHVAASGAIQQLLASQTRLFMGYVYESVENAASAVSGLRALRSWTRRWAIVSRVGSHTYLEVAFYHVQAMDPSRHPPSSIFMLNATAPVQLATSDKWFNDKPFALLVRGARLKGPGVVGSEEMLELAALDAPSFAAWSAFLAQGATAPAAVTVRDDAKQVDTPAAERSVDIPAARDFNEAPIAQALTEAPVALTEALVVLESDVASAPSAPSMEDGRSRAQCILCDNGSQNAVCVPCGHAALCMGCAVELQAAVCFVCNVPIREVVELFHP